MLSLLLLVFLLLLLLLLPLTLRLRLRLRLRLLLRLRLRLTLRLRLLLPMLLFIVFAHSRLCACVCWMAVFVLIDTADACRIAARCAAIRCPRCMRIELYLRIAVYVSVPLEYVCVCWMAVFVLIDTADACRV